MNHRERLLDLQSVLLQHQSLWRPQPFHVPRPAWCDQWPALAGAVLGLDEPALERFIADPAACRAWLAPRLPIVGMLEALCHMPALAPRALPPVDTRFDWSIPGRKREQVEAFAAHGPAAHAPLLEWCAGKGHLGRRLALADRMPVSSLELDPALCEAAQRLARRAGIEQTVLCADALAPGSREHVRGHAVVALHACGELHRTLVRSAADDRAHSYRIAPCCYHLGADDGYRPLSSEASLPLDAAALRLAVTETVTAPRHVRQRLARDQAWKLGFIALRNALEGEAIRPFRPVPSPWLSGDFAGFCKALAQRERVHLPAAIDWTHWLASGERRRAEVRRFELVRHAFRRALETWLVMDLALGFEEAGFDVEVGTFCPRALTPRNLLVLARRRKIYHPRPHAGRRQFLP
ncbi:methyltransferase [Aromatoleum buckelii]|uniref:Methyltransferase n=1 Tax=Aromatoleum buckelii TaxID=200254 RepID=A0ABX1N6S5_9RHOO|nr:methyltransferase [Aromatoleum buckelii]MCK0511643.1 SAM-dependent methyltransferase [Aromatoleum buckelii]